MNKETYKKPTVPRQHKPLGTVVGIEAIEAFEPDKPETHTQSKVINAVLETILAYRLSKLQDIAAYLEVDATELDHTIHLVTGLSFTHLLAHFATATAVRLRQADPDLSPDAIAHQLGLHDRSSLWRMEHSRRK